MPSGISPPDFKNWVEDERLREKRYFFAKRFHYDFHCYWNPKAKCYFEGIITIGFAKLGIILIGWDVKLDKEDQNKFYFLKMEDGSWIRGKANRAPKIDVELEGEGAANFAVSIPTEKGEVVRNIKIKI